AVRTAFDPVLRQVRVEVVDSGPGIPDEDREKLFLPHFSTKKKGAGLGLSIVNQIIKEHDGTVSAQNNPTGGAQFTIELPA
ncbi:MAG: ATP-binding protein, partial [Candidatus Aminicenantes bacterium]|nr:ATP-binding protein [Candidatus Aminicenantes bacterium]